MPWEPLEPGGRGMLDIISNPDCPEPITMTV